MRRFHMNWEQVKGNWKQAKGQVKRQWGKLTDDELDVISGNRDILVGRIQEAYGNATSPDTGRTTTVLRSR
jgi:uncharacterized protein YjbJ (UPF0337 family)